MIKIDTLDAHDRYQHFTTKDFSLSEYCQKLIEKRPFGNYPFYLFAHSRRHDDGINTRLIWQSRLTRPSPQTNSMLFKAYPGTDLVKIIWMIPAREMWSNYNKGNVAQSDLVLDSINTFKNNRKLLEQPEDDDLSDQEIASIYRELSSEFKRQRIMESLWKLN